MKRHYAAALLALLLLSASALKAENYQIRTSNTSLVLSAEAGAPVEVVYYGAALTDTDFQNIINAGVTTQHKAYPVFGLVGDRPTAFAATHHDGNMTTKLVFDSYSEEKTGGVSVSRFHMKDEVYPLTVDLCYQTFDDCDVIETWVEVKNMEKGPVVLREFASGFLPIRCGDVYLSYQTGARQAECNVQTEKVLRGTRVIDGVDGVRTTHLTHAEVMFSLDGEPQENTGATIGAALLYTGNFRLKTNWIDEDWICFSAGIHPDNSAYTLAKKETFVTPRLAFSWGNEGLGGISRQFHRWGRSHHLLHTSQVRDVVLNSWEGVRFDIDQKTMEDMMSDAAYAGAELFVMDDGWFGGKYQRQDGYAMGDWVCDTRKLPGGIQPLIDFAKSKGLKFGIWIEPEMVDLHSELYEKHPEWILKGKDREINRGRGGSQMILDMGNPEVQDFAFKVVDDLMTQYPDIYYIKWDANMTQQDWGSQYLPMDSQSHLQIEFQRGFAAVCERIRAKYPDLIMQDCASGGGRVNWGYLGWFDEFWDSDNTDAIQRLYMQWGTSYFFPAIAMASHISAVPNTENWRTTSLKFRTDVCMSGRLGIELQPKHMTSEELEQTRAAVAEYKQYIREVVQMGDLYRLVSPYSGIGLSSLMYVSEAKDKAAFFWWKIDQKCDEHYPRVKMAGLDPAALYRIKEINRIDEAPLSCEGAVFSGKFLMECGLEFPYRHKCDIKLRGNNSSRVLYLERVAE